MSRRVGVVFGGRSVEHEVSVLTAQQVMAALEGGGHQPVPLYVAKSGEWYSGPVLRDLEAFRDVDRVLRTAQPVQLQRLDGGAAVVQPVRRGGLFGGARDSQSVEVAMPLIHGSNGEDGTLQGMLEMLGIPYTGSGVAASALSMDKVLSKAVLRDAGLPVIAQRTIHRAPWRRDRAATRSAAVDGLAFPMFVKPATLGSSIGVSQVADAAALDDAVELALVYDTRCLVEPAQVGAVDINCAVLGRPGEARASVCEQPVSSGLLSYADKYLSKATGAKGATGKRAGGGMKSAQRHIPAPLDAALSERIQAAAVHAFAAIGAEGVARVDFLVDAAQATFVVNEVNTIPGSLAFYLWEASGVAFTALLDSLLELALQRHAEQRETVYSIDTWLLRGRPG